MRRMSFLGAIALFSIGGLAACGQSSGLEVRAVDSPAVEPLPTLAGASADLAPAQLPAPDTAVATPAPAPASTPAPVVTTVVVTAAPVPVETATPAVTVPPAPAPAPAPDSVAPAPVPGEAVVVAAAPALPSAAVTTTAFTSPPTTVIVKHEMPNVVCMKLQDAQNLIQKAGVFYSKSFDATGKNRKQAWDRSWIVVSQNLAPGTAFGEGDAKLGVVKTDDPNDC